MTTQPGIINDEYVIIVDSENRIVCRELRSVMRKRRLIHRATFILVFDSVGRLFVQKRSRNKDLYPGYYDLSTGGVVVWGEEMAASAQREIGEELGIHEPTLEFLFDFFYDSPENRVFGHGFRCRFDGPLSLQEEEIESGAFLSLEEVYHLMKHHPVTPESIYVFTQYHTRFVKP